MTADHPEARGALDGVRVLDLGMGMAPAFAAMFLADHGAEVVKVERNGDRVRRAGATLTWDRGKRSLVVDPDSAADRETLTDLLHGADIVVDGWGAGVLDGFGLGEAAVRAANRSVIWCTLGDPDEPHLDDELLASARYGVFAESPGHREGPVFTGHPAVGYSTGFVTLIGILAALRARLVTGDGDHVAVSHRDGVLAQMGMNWWSERALSFVAAKARTGRLDMGRRRLLLERYMTSDGRMIQVHTGAAGGFARAMEAFGLQDRITAATTAVETASELTDEDLAVLRTELPALVATQPAAYWMERLWRHEVACLPVQPPGAVFDDEQIAYAGVVHEIDLPDVGLARTVGPVVKFSRTPARQPVRPPAPDADGDSLRATGWASAGLGPTASPRALAHPLDGVRIVEFANWFASPYGNRLLRDLGADVVKVEPVQGDPIRPLPDPCEGANAGKRDLAVDLKQPGAGPLLERLLATADIVQHNLRPGAAERLSIDKATARTLNPNVIYAHAPGYGTAGPKAKLQSFAPLLSGFVGLMHLAAGPGNVPHTCFGNEDYYNGLLSAASQLLALVHRERTGEGQDIECPQLHSSILVTSEHVIVDGVVRSMLPTLDPTQSRWDVGLGLYQCLEGWLCVAARTDAQLMSFGAIVGTLEADGAVDAMFGRTAAEWTDELRAAGVPCEVAREEAWFRPFLKDDATVAAGLAVEIEHPLHGRARVIGELFHLRQHPARTRIRSALLGEQSLEVLEELGIDEATRHDLVDQRVVAVASAPAGAGR